jgi:two-component system, OmpR family, alkaline phosphatase synthesis response regulator PhoP
MPNGVIIYVVDDEPNIRGLLSFNLQASGFSTMEFENAESALAQAVAFPPHLILLDLMLPGMDGIEFCRRIRASESTHHTPIIMLTARGEEFDRVLGLEIGADDYITKPFSTREVIARVKAVLRRTSQNESEPVEPVLAVGDLSVDLDQRIVRKNGSELPMPLKEFDLLRYMIENRGRVLTREQLLDHVWGYDYVGETRTVDVHVRHLRMKVENDPDNPAMIETVRGIGYRFSAK